MKKRGGNRRRLIALVRLSRKGVLQRAAKALLRLRDVRITIVLEIGIGSNSFLNDFLFADLLIADVPDGV
jgi:hypothetical protein